MKKLGVIEFFEINRNTYDKFIIIRSILKNFVNMNDVEKLLNNSNRRPSIIGLGWDVNMGVFSRDVYYPFSATPMARTISGDSTRTIRILNSKNDFV